MFGKVGQKDKLFFTKHLSIMVASGIPLAEALETLIEQTKSKKLKSITSNILKDVENGQALAKSMEKHRKVFGQLYISMIAVGEKTGELEKILEFLSTQMTKDYALRKKVQAAMLYPAIVLSATMLMGGFITFFILPKLIVFFEDFEIELPITTKILLFFGKLVQNHGILLVIIAVVLMFSISFASRIEALKPFWHKLLLKLPLIGNFLSLAQLTTFTRNLGTLLSSGVPVTEAVETTANTLSNISFKNEVLLIKKSIEKGKNISEALDLHKHSNFPPVAIKMIGIGEKTGKLDETLVYLSDFFEEEIDNISKNLSTIIEPVLLITIGIAVAFVALAIISPIYELTGSIRR